MYDRVKQTTAVLLTILAVGGCASTGGGETESFATVVIHNDATTTVTIYALRHGGARIRLGQINGLSRAEFPLRRHMLSGGGRLQLLIDPLGSRQSYPSNEIAVNQGDVIQLTVSSFIR